MKDAVGNSLRRLVVASALLGTAAVSLSGAAQANTTSTIAIAAGAAAIVGALLIDGNNQPYYIYNNQRHYVSQDQANYYRQHHRVVQRRAYVPESEYPIYNNSRHR
ncbi:MAG: hypothetical protein ACLPYS_04465 [Vulcanimicrobiaceae bacterium]